jgi:hypothetical protein
MKTKKGMECFWPKEEILGNLILTLVKFFPTLYELKQSHKIVIIGRESTCVIARE